MKLYQESESFGMSHESHLGVRKVGDMGRIRTVVALSQSSVPYYSFTPAMIFCS